VGGRASLAIVNVRVSKRARREADRRDAWWRVNRLEAVDLFSRELADVIDRLAVEPNAGRLYEAARFDAAVRRVLMPRTETHVYSARVGEDVVILAVWSARRARGPRL
jgi:plasmid stabilization system protein ParE